MREVELKKNSGSRREQTILLTTATLILLTIAVSCFITGETVQGWAFIAVIWVCSVGWRIKKRSRLTTSKISKDSSLIKRTG